MSARELLTIIAYICDIPVQTLLSNIYVHSRSLEDQLCIWNTCNEQLVSDLLHMGVGPELHAPVGRVLSGYYGEYSPNTIQGVMQCFSL